MRQEQTQENQVPAEGETHLQDASPGGPAALIHAHVSFQRKKVGRTGNKRLFTATAVRRLRYQPAGRAQQGGGAAGRKAEIH